MTRKARGSGRGEGRSGSTAATVVLEWRGAGGWVDSKFRTSKSMVANYCLGDHAAGMVEPPFLASSAPTSTFPGDGSTDRSTSVPPRPRLLEENKTSFSVPAPVSPQLPR
uniref:Uncharacterized protein n=1 Tax=Oryza barthii TaxID=65489 RepID=A0A0D3HV58_9ORYZ